MTLLFNGLQVVRAGESWKLPNHDLPRADVIHRVKNVVGFCL